MVLTKSRKVKNVSATFSRRSNPNLNCTLLIIREYLRTIILKLRFHFLIIFLNKQSRFLMKLSRLSTNFAFFICSQGGHHLEYATRKLDARMGYSKRKDMFAPKRFLVRFIIFRNSPNSIIIKVNLSFYIK